MRLLHASQAAVTIASYPSKTRLDSLACRRNYQTFSTGFNSGDLGGSARAAAERFDVSVSSAARWAQRWRSEGHARPRAMGGDRRSRLSEHRARVLQLIAQQPDLTLQEIRSALAALGITVGLSTVHRYLSAQNLTLKKRAYTRPSRTVRM